MTDKPPKKRSLVLRTYQRVEKLKPPPGQPIDAAAHAGQNFVVFCSASACPHYYDNLSAIPFWTEDCPEVLNVLRCPECGSPVVRLPHED